MFNGTVLEQVKHAKFLGVYIDEHLTRRRRRSMQAQAQSLFAASKIQY